MSRGGMEGAREQGRTEGGRGRETRGMDGATAQRSDTRGRAGDRGSCCVSSSTTQVERAQATEDKGRGERECMRKGGREEVSLFTWRLLCLTLLSTWALEGAELIRRCQLLLSLLFFFLLSRLHGGQLDFSAETTVINLHGKDWEIETSVSMRE